MPFRGSLFRFFGPVPAFVFPLFGASVTSIGLSILANIFGIVVSYLLLGRVAGWHRIGSGDAADRFAFRWPPEGAVSALPRSARSLVPMVWRSV
jgi:hypothetical protein